MKTIAENLQIIKDSIEAIKQAIIDKGGTVNGNITTYANAIRNLENNFDDNGHNYKVVFQDDTVIDPRNTITKIIIPAKIKIIGPYSFSEYYQLQSVVFESDSELTSIGESAFDNCQSLTSINIPEGVTSIGNSAFNGCSSISSINIPENVTSIGDYAFEYCESLENITIPASVTSIGGSAFKGCMNLTDLTCNAVTPPTIGSSYTFYGVNKSIPVYVPADSVEAYKAANYWKDFTNIQARLITFSVGSVEYQAEEGITWEEWINEYGYQFDFTIRNNSVCYGLNPIIDSSSESVYINDIIQKDGFYNTFSGGAN